MLDAIPLPLAAAAVMSGNNGLTGYGFLGAGTGSAVTAACVVGTEVMVAEEGKMVAKGGLAGARRSSDLLGVVGLTRLRERLRLLLGAELGRTLMFLTLAKGCAEEGRM